MPKKIILKNSERLFSSLPGKLNKHSLLAAGDDANDGRSDFASGGSTDHMYCRYSQEH